MMRSVFLGMLLVATTYTYSLRDIPAVADAPQQSLICEVCEFVGDEVNKRILTDQAKDEIITIAELVCGELPIFAKECKTAVEEHGKSVIDQLFELLDTETICAELHLCSSKNEIPSFFRVKDNQGCKACMDGLNIVKMILNSDELTDLLNIAVNEICMAAGGNPTQCEPITSKIIDEILDNLLPMFNPEAICKNSGACPSLLAASEDDGCIACTDGFQIIKNLLTSTEISELLDIAINETCIAVGVGVDVCENLIGSIVHEILDNLMNSFNPSILCSKLGACPALREPCPYLEFLGSDEGCKACVDALDIVDQILKSPKTLDLLHIAVDEICISIGGDVATCEATIKGILDPIIKNLITLFDPTALCKQSGACPSLQLAVPTDAVCLACSDSITIIKKALESFEFFELVHIGINKTCAQYAGPGEKQCIMIFTVILDNINKQLLPFLNPHNICVNVGACVGALSELEVSGGIYCETCLVGVIELQNIAADNETDVILDDLTDIVCNIIQIPYCKSMIKSVIAESLDDISHLNPNATCTSIGACFDDIAIEALEEEIVPVADLGDVCSECVASADEIINLLKNPEVDSLVKEAIGEICTLIAISNCEATLDGYFDELLSLIKDLDGKTLCSLIGLCSSKVPETRIPEVPALGLGDTCSECTLMINLLLDQLKDPTTQQEVEAALDGVCAVLPISNCKETIHQYLVIAETFIYSLDGKTLCAYFGLCSATSEYFVEWNI